MAAASAWRPAWLALLMAACGSCSADAGGGIGRRGLRPGAGIAGARGSGSTAVCPPSHTVVASSSSAARAAWWCSCSVVGLVVAVRRMCASACV